MDFPAIFDYPFAVFGSSPAAHGVAQEIAASKSFPERAPWSKASRAWVRRSSIGAWLVTEPDIGRDTDDHQ